MAERDMEVMPGSWETSGTESQKITRLEPPVVIATQMLEDVASAPAERGTDELADTGLLGRAANWACPE
jgi:hypothetical protein